MGSVLQSYTNSQAMQPVKGRSVSSKKAVYVVYVTNEND